jgi:hypothetical protein
MWQLYVVYNCEGTDLYMMHEQVSRRSNAVVDFRCAKSGGMIPHEKKIPCRFPLIVRAYGHALMSARVHLTRREMERQIVSSQNHENCAATLNGCCKGVQDHQKNGRSPLNPIPKERNSIHIFCHDNGRICKRRGSSVVGLSNPNK